MEEAVSLESSKSIETSGIETKFRNLDQNDAAVCAYMICCEKLHFLEQKVEELVQRAEERSQILQRLQRLKQLILKSENSMDESELSDEMLALLEQARAEGLPLSELSWSSAEEKAGIIDEIQLHMSSVEAKNIPDRSYMSLFMSQRTEVSNLFSKILSDHHSTLMRMAQKLIPGSR